MSVLDEFRLDGEAALVTGAAGGIGGGFAAAMAEAGANVALVDIDEDGLETTADRLRTDTDSEVLTITANVSEQDDTERMVEEVVEAFGGLDIAFANAGIACLGGSPEAYDMDAWDELMRISLRGAFMTDRAAIGAMKDDDGGRIINTASILGLNGTDVPGLSAYTAAKGGVVQITRQLATEVGRHDIRVNAIAPGWIGTAMTEGMVPPGEAGEPIREELRDRMAISRLGEPADLKGTAVYLASEASGYTTGEVVLVDGGMNAFQ
jgi:NAD(P)-dependent dehydrogenase (short-subunit alcohol dehydrogenase family)